MNGNKINIRPLDLGDAPAIYKIAIDPQVNRTLLLLPSMPYKGTEAWINSPAPGDHRLVAEIDGVVVGSVSMGQPQNPRFRHAGHIGLMVHHDYWGQGVGSALMAAIIDLADNWFNLLRLELEVFSNNLAAVHLYEKFGFELEGTKRMVVFSDGQYQDEHVMARLSPNAPEVTPLPAVAYPQRHDVQSITIRPSRVEDARDLNEGYINPDSARNTSQLPSQEMHIVEERIRNEGPEIHRYSAVATHLDDSEKVVGSATLRTSQNSRMRHKGGIGVAVHPHYWGIGIGSTLMDEVINLADNYFGLMRLELAVNSDNMVAIHIYEKLGFEIEGTNRLSNFGHGRWADTHFMARIVGR